MHGNDTRQTSYDSYVLLPEAMSENNIFSNSFAIRRRATLQDAEFLPISEYPCSVTEPGRPTNPSNLNAERRAALLLGGESVPTVVLKSLLNNQSGKPILSSHADIVVCHNFTPLDAGLEHAVLRQNLIGPVQYRCCSVGLDAESAQWTNSKVARSLLLDWKASSFKLIPNGPMQFQPDLQTSDAQRFGAPPVPTDFTLFTLDPQTNLPQISISLRKKWAEDPVYGPAWIEELKKADEILTSPAGRDRLIQAGNQGAGAEGGQSSEGADAAELPDGWDVQDKSGLSALGSIHECASEIPNVNLHVAQQGDEVKVFMSVKRAMTVPADQVLFKMAAADWFKPPKSTRLLASDSELWLHVFELHTDEAPVMCEIPGENGTFVEGPVQTLRSVMHEAEANGLVDLKLWGHHLQRPAASAIANTSESDYFECKPLQGDDSASQWVLKVKNPPTLENSRGSNLGSFLASEQLHESPRLKKTWLLSVDQVQTMMVPKKPNFVLKSEIALQEDKMVRIC